MNSDVEKGADEVNGDPKKDVEGEEPAEDSPLKGNDANMEGKEAEAAAGEMSAKEGGKGLQGWLSQSRVKWWIAFLVAVVLLTIVLIGTLIAVGSDDFDIPDNSVRLVKIWPRPNRGRNLIHFIHGSLPLEGRIWPDLTKELDVLLRRYQPSKNRSRHVVECFAGTRILDDSKVCKFDITTLMLECTKTMNYGYDMGKPCIFLEFRNLTEWMPELYTARELEPYVEAADGSVSNMLYLDCQGDTLIDQENMGRIQYTPDRGFPTQFFPYKGHPEYMSPIVGIRFTKPAVGVVISVTCKFWAKNLNHTDEAIPSGQIHFNLLVD